MEDLISRADAIRLLKNELSMLDARALDKAVIVLREMPQTLPARGSWRFNHNSERYDCSCCGWSLALGVDPSRYGLRFCMQCGAEME